jgi:hypothetical protein
VAIEELQRALNDFLPHLLAMMSLSHVRPGRCVLLTRIHGQGPIQRREHSLITKM